MLAHTANADTSETGIDDALMMSFIKFPVPVQTKAGDKKDNTRKGNTNPRI
jgi:hypothetical protein